MLKLQHSNKPLHNWIVMIIKISAPVLYMHMYLYISINITILYTYMHVYTYMYTYMYNDIKYWTIGTMKNSRVSYEPYGQWNESRKFLSSSRNENSWINSYAFITFFTQVYFLYPIIDLFSLIALIYLFSIPLNIVLCCCIFPSI